MEQAYIFSPILCNLHCIYECWISYFQQWCRSLDEKILLTARFWIETFQGRPRIKHFQPSIHGLIYLKLHHFVFSSGKWQAAVFHAEWLIMPCTEWFNWVRNRRSTWGWQDRHGVQCTEGLFAYKLHYSFTKETTIVCLCLWEITKELGDVPPSARRLLYKPKDSTCLLGKYKAVTA